MSFVPPFHLRPYQITAIRRANNFIKNNNQNTNGAIIEIATGMGKSAVIANIAADCIRNSYTPILLTHNIVLLQQNLKALNYWAGIKENNIEVLHRSYPSNAAHALMFASTPQSLFAKSALGEKRRLLLKNAIRQQKTVLIIDEIHWGIQEKASYERAVKWFQRQGAEQKGLILIGLSATPYMRQQIPAAERDELYRRRNDLRDKLKTKTSLNGLVEGESYSEVRKDISAINLFLLSTHYQMIHNVSPLFSTLLCQFDLKYGIQNQYLTKPVFHHDSIPEVTDALADSQDFDAFGEVRIKTQEKILEHQFNAIWERIAGLDLKQALIFVPSRKIAIDLTKKAPDIADYIISGTLEIDDDKTIKNDANKEQEIIENFKSGKIKYLINVGKLTTGFDFPALENIILLRNIRSKALFTQIIGRAMRIAPNKEACNIYDYTATIDGLARQEVAVFALENSVRKADAEDYLKDLNRSEIVERILSSPSPSPFKIPPTSQILRQFPCSCGRVYTPQKAFICPCGRSVRFVRKGKLISYPFWGLYKYYEAFGGLRYVVARIAENQGFAKYIAEQYLNWLMFYRVGNFQAYQPDAEIIIANAFKAYPSIILDALIPEDALIDSALFIGGDLAIENAIPHPVVECPNCKSEIPGNLRKCPDCKKEILASCHIPRKIRTEGLLDKTQDNYEILNAVSQAISAMSHLEFGYVKASLEVGRNSNCWQIRAIFHLKKPVKNRRTYAKYFHFAGDKGRQDFEELKQIGVINAAADFSKTVKRGLPERQRHHFLLLLTERLQNIVDKGIFLRVEGDDYYPDIHLFR